MPRAVRGRAHEARAVLPRCALAARRRRRGRRTPTRSSATSSTRRASRISSGSIRTRRKGGDLTLVPPLRITNFDKYNPFTLKGTAPPGLGGAGVRDRC